MSCQEYLGERLRKEMYEGNMHACLRDVGRLAGGFLAAGSLTAGQVNQLAELAEELAINPAEAATKWMEAVEFGRGEPIRWEHHKAASHQPGRVLDWDDEIRDDYQVVESGWIEDIEVVEPETWDPIAQVSEYLSTLFSSEEFVGYVTESWEKDGRQLPSRGNYGRTAGELLAELARYRDMGAVFGDTNPEVGAWIRFNPLDGQGVRDANVTDFRFALVESDQLPIEQQRGVYEKLELPIAALVHSGNKSLHAIVRIEADSLAQYKQRVDLLYKVCEKNGLLIDRQNKNPSRLSRMPGVERRGVKQFLVATNVGKPTWAAWEEWIEAENDNLPPLESLAVEWGNLPPLSPPLIDGVLRRGHKMLLSGASKGGKSFMLIQLCAAIAEGRQWLGHDCAQGRVLYVNLELDRASCLHRFRAVYESLGWPARSLEDIDIWNLRGQAIPMDRLAPKLIRRAHKREYAAVIIDPIYKVITGDENAADKMAFFCNQFDKVCHELRSAVIYCHHHSKGAQGGKRSMDRASGSGVFARDPDALLDLIELVVSPDLRRKQEQEAVCSLIGRELSRLAPGWRDHAEDGVQDSETGLLSLSSRLLGLGRHGDLVLPQVVALREEVAGRSAWRVEGTFREYPQPQPVHIWFRHPIHVIDSAGILQDCDTHQDEPPWKRGARRNKAESPAREDSRRKRLRQAYETLAENGKARLDEVAEYLDLRTPKTVRTWAKEIAGWKVVDGFLLPANDNGESDGGRENAF